MRSLEAIFDLRPAFSEEQVRALAAVFDEQLATKDGLEATRLTLAAEIEKLRVESRRDVELFRSEVKRDLDLVRADIEKLRLSNERDLKAAEARLVMWMLGQGVAIVSLLFALLKLVH